MVENIVAQEGYLYKIPVRGFIPIFLYPDFCPVGIRDMYESHPTYVIYIDNNISGHVVLSISWYINRAFAYVFKDRAQLFCIIDMIRCNSHRVVTCRDENLEHLVENFIANTWPNVSSDWKNICASAELVEFIQNI